ncbi:hypothetical protein CP533_6361 [Ophiocordyceps camponoti-saundersi (nom. inval.)]|nr:hypothetical protein CP533_6361 [Ophiocordyceps camponoti-saundersi (nom. inval.)]
MSSRVVRGPDADNVVPDRGRLVKIRIGFDHYINKLVFDIDDSTENRLAIALRENEELRRELSRCRDELNHFHQRDHVDRQRDHADQGPEMDWDHEKKQLLEIGSEFHDYWLQQGANGGRMAAQAIQTAIADDFGHRVGQCKVIVRIVVDFEGLAQYLGGDNAHVVENCLRDFALGFADTPPKFDFKLVAIGHTSHTTSSELRAMTDGHLENPDCMHVILGMQGTTNNNRFLAFLAENGFNSDRLSILPNGNLGAAAAFGYVDWAGDFFRVETSEAVGHRD